MTEAMRALASGTPGDLTGYLVGGLKVDGLYVELMWVDYAMPGTRDRSTLRRLGSN
ncbi:hypothetical protein [Methanosphaerula subterraneus]|uniref:hypothetical protein n=1 Tax=Methanosphaerula subterraneus TaxID=3350244 RepID=UPI003F86C7F2